MNCYRLSSNIMDNNGISEGLYEEKVVWYVVMDMLTHLLLDKMAAISQMIYSYTFSWMKSFEFWLKNITEVYS